MQIESLAYCPGSAFQVAIATIAGQMLGAGESQRANTAIRQTCLVAVSFYTLTGGIFYAFGLQFAQLFTARADDPAAALAAAYLAVVALSMPSLAVVVVLSGALRGVGDTNWLLFITFLGLGLVRIPGACWLAWDQVDIPGMGMSIRGWNLGVYGAWYAMVADVVLRSLLLAGRFFHGGWKRVQI